MTSAPPFLVRRAGWSADAALLRRVRHAVFIIEQQVPEDLEWDEFDPLSVHVLALDAAGEAIGTGRLLPDGRIGRMAVCTAWRGRGVGRSILYCLIDIARERGDSTVQLHAQTHALGFYAHAGFIVHGAIFMEAGIPHQAMTLRL